MSDSGSSVVEVENVNGDFVYQKLDDADEFGESSNISPFSSVSAAVSSDNVSEKLEDLKLSDGGESGESAAVSSLSSDDASVSSSLAVEIATEGEQDLQKGESCDSLSDKEISEAVEDSEVASLKGRLSTLFCHFNWRPDKSSPYFSVDEVIDTANSREPTDYAQKFPFHDFNTTIMLGYSVALKGEYEKALEITESCRELIKDDDLKCYEEGLRYIVDGDLAHIQFHLGNLEASKELLSAVENKFDKLEKRQWGVIYAIVGSSYRKFDTMALPEAAHYFRMAIENDPGVAEWHYLLGRTLSGIRRGNDRFSAPTPEEIDHLNRAAEFSNMPSYKVLLGQAYMDKASFLNRGRGFNKPKDEIDSLNARAFHLFSQAVNENPDCPGTNVRCGKAFMTLPLNYRDVDLAEKCLMKAVQLAPEKNIANHYLGNFYDRIKHDDSRAREYYEKCIALPSGNYGAELDLLRLKFRQDEFYDAFEDLKNIVTRYKAKEVASKIQLGLYYYLRRKDIPAAINELIEAVELKPESPGLWKVYPVFQRGEYYDVYHLVPYLLQVQVAESAAGDKEKADYYLEKLQWINMLAKDHGYSSRY